MQNKRNQSSSIGQMIQRCHKWRQRRKQYMDQARQCQDEIERERLMQAAEHYGRIVNAEQERIDSIRDPRERAAAEAAAAAVESQPDNGEDEEAPFPDFITNLK